MCKHIEIAVQILYCFLNSLNCICMYFGLGDICLNKSLELSFGQLSDIQTTKFQTVTGIWIRM